MKYIEELHNGHKFIYNKYCYIVTSDYKNSKTDIQRMCINLHNGNPTWLLNNTIVEQIFILYQNQENTLIEIKNEQNY
jgi:hypothetical protein